MLDPAQIEQRIAQAVASAGESPWLVGYDANGIQEFITACGRPISMRGASEVIKAFDEESRQDPLTIFAGGGRGIQLARSEGDARTAVAGFGERFRGMTHGGVMAACFVPLQGEAASIRWLRHRLDVEKDAAPPPEGSLPTNKESECAYCRSYLGACPRKRDGLVERVCKRCDAMLERGREAGKAGESGGRKGEMSQSLAEIGDRQRIAAVSADGNSLGVLFESLGSLVELAAVSEAVNDIFQYAHGQALERIDPDRRVPLMTGGDDVRAFMPPSAVLDYVQTLALAVEARADEYAAHLRGIVSASTAKRLAHLGVGIGAVIASDHYPAWRLMDYAHMLERRAKAGCHANPSWRSALDFAIITTEGSMTADLDRTRATRDIRPLPLLGGPWQRARDRAEGLAAMPTGQLGILAAEPVLRGEDGPGENGNEEFANLYRYQVARSDAWRRWYEQHGLDWRDPQNVVDQRPDPGTLELAALIQWQGDER